jgi:hypothetical protein
MPQCQKKAFKHIFYSNSYQLSFLHLIIAIADITSTLTSARGKQEGKFENSRTILFCKKCLIYFKCHFFLRKKHSLCKSTITTSRSWVRIMEKIPLHISQFLFWVNHNIPLFRVQVAFPRPSSLDCMNADLLNFRCSKTLIYLASKWKAKMHSMWNHTVNWRFTFTKFAYWFLG